MSKTLKSIKVDNEILKFVDEYSDIMKSVFGEVSTFTTMVEDGLKLYLSNQLKFLSTISNQQVIYDNGKIKELYIPNETLYKISALKNDLFSKINEE